MRPRAGLPCRTHSVDRRQLLSRARCGAFTWNRVLAACHLGSRLTRVSVKGCSPSSDTNPCPTRHPYDQKSIRVFRFGAKCHCLRAAVLGGLSTPFYASLVDSPVQLSALWWLVCLACRRAKPIIHYFLETEHPCRLLVIWIPVLSEFGDTRGEVGTLRPSGTHTRRMASQEPRQGAVLRDLVRYAVRSSRNGRLGTEARRSGISRSI